VQSNGVAPFLRWSGGKRAIAKQIIARFPKSKGAYFEPFLGSGAILFALAPSSKVFVNDLNSELMNTYRVVRDSLEELETTIRGMEISRDYFYELRNQDRQSTYEALSAVEKAARFIYLNHCGFNGLYRVNSNGHYNVPWGEPKVSLEKRISSLGPVSEYLNRRDAHSGEQLVNLLDGHFDFIAQNGLVKANDIVYMDPPYDIEAGESGFVSYQKGGFSSAEQDKVLHLASEMRDLGAHVFISNSKTEAVLRNYAAAGFNIEDIAVHRSIAADHSHRRHKTEVLISG
jgi:DNA adenine methylase